MFFLDGSVGVVQFYLEKERMSFKYSVLKKAVKIINMRKMFDDSPENLVSRAKKQNSNTPIPELADKDFDISRIDVMGFPVIKMIHKSKSEKANLFIIGGGMIKCPRPGSIKKALKIAKLTDLDLYIPYYPLCTDYPVTKAYEMIHETYKTMLKDYKASNISVLGTSSGGNLALGIPAYINANNLDVPMPGSILAISPGTCVATEEERARMMELDKKDLVIPASYMDNAEIIMKHGEKVPEYMLKLQLGDFSRCPKVTLMYGSDECLYAFGPSFEKSLAKKGHLCKIIVGQGMFHVYPVFPICKEAKEGWDQMIGILRQSN
jgi:acetyl esterase/lipase